jgi:hypothetical protein
MTVIAPWPVVVRDRIVHAFKPGAPAAAEGPFRTLRRHAWVSSGVRITRRDGRGFAGQLTVYSSLNVFAARLARRGDAPAAVRVARAAADLESGSEFAQLHRLLSGLPGLEAEQVLEGSLPEGAHVELAEAIRAVASRTERLRAADIALSSPAEVVFAGHVAEVTQRYVVLMEEEGTTTMVPRWMAGAAKRERPGEFLALVADKLDDASAVVLAVPAIDLEGIHAAPDYSPFTRADRRTLSITADDARLLAGEPRPLRILVPVTIDG